MQETITFGLKGLENSNHRVDSSNYLMQTQQIVSQKGFRVIHET